MSWVVRVSDALNEGVLVEAENGVVMDGSNPVVAVRGFDPPVVVPPGSCRVLNLYVRTSALPVPPRGIVQMLIDDEPVFWGPATVVPPPESPGAGPFDEDRDALERVTVVGGEQLLRDSIVGPRLLEGEFDVSEIALELCELYAHPALTVSELNFPSTGAVLTAWYAPEMTLYDALQTLVNTVPGGATAWVDAEGNVRFEALEGAS